MLPAPVQGADRAGAVRRAMWGIGQARRRTLSASSTGPSGCISAGISGFGRLNRMARYAFAAPMPYLPRRKSNAGGMECEKCGLVPPLPKFVTHCGVLGHELPEAKGARVSRFRSSLYAAARSGANFGIEGTLANL